MQSGWALGYMLAAGVTALVLPRYGWRVLFLVGVLPALLTAWVRKYVAEPEIWQRSPERPPVTSLFRGHLLRRTVLATALSTSVMFAYWGLFTWLPPFLSAPASEGGAGLDVMRTSGWIFAVQSGSLAGYLLFGWSADRFGRRHTFAFYVLAAAILTPIYGYLPAWGGVEALLALGPLVGFFGSGYFSLFGAMLAEIYPTALRGAGQGLTYNLGRSLSAAAPFITGFVADRSGFGAALAFNAVFFVAGAFLVYTLPETRSVKLDTVR
jgi:MFS family permease